MNPDGNDFPRDLDGAERMARYVTVAYIADSVGLLPNEYKLHLAHLAEHYGSGPSWRETIEAKLGVDAELIREFFAVCAADGIPLREAFFVVLGFFGCTGFDPEIDELFRSLSAGNGGFRPDMN